MESLEDEKEEITQSINAENSVGENKRQRVVLEALPREFNNVLTRDTQKENGT